MLPTEELFVYVYVLIHDLMLGRAIVVPDRPGPAPACTDAELLAIAIVRHLLGRRSEAGFLAEVARDWGHLFPRLPHQSEANRRTRWLWGAFEQIRITLAARLPEDDCQQVDTSALPVKHPSRVRGPDQRTGPGNDLAARFGRDAAHAEWFYGFRLAVRTDLGSRIVRAWAIVPAAVSERDVAIDLLEAGPAPRDLLADKGFSGGAFEAELAARGTAVLVPPDKPQRAAMPAILLKVIAEWRNRIETIFSDLAHHCLDRGVGAVCVTLDERGCVAFFRDGSGGVAGEFVDRIEVEHVVDTTGAGDSFAGGLAYGYLAYRDYVVACQYGNAMGAQRCTGTELDVYLSREETERQILAAYGRRPQEEVP